MTSPQNKKQKREGMYVTSHKKITRWVLVLQQEGDNYIIL